jgi:hypothetical protein
VWEREKTRGEGGCGGRERGGQYMSLKSRSFLKRKYNVLDNTERVEGREKGGKPELGNLA